jgi:hypothetical protein
MTMKIVFFMLLSLNAFGQISYQKGYIIDNHDQRLECLIKNVDWKNNPEEFLYRNEGDNEIKRGTLALIKEFGIYGYSRFKRANVKIDRSGSAVDELTYDRNPVWSQETRFLKVLVDAKASLYSYDEDKLERYFYSLNDTSIHQLVYKKYMVQSSQDITMTKANNEFRQQLWVNVKCSNTKMSTVERIDYNGKELTKYFKEQSNCDGGSITVADVSEKRDIFNIKITPGFNYSSVQLTNPLLPTINFQNTINARLGVEFELHLPFNKNKWSLVFEPTAQWLKTEQPQVAWIDYGFMDFPIGVRYYSFLNKQTALFVNGFVILTAPIYFSSHPAVNLYQGGSLDISHANTNMALGLGIRHRRISFEMRYYSSIGLTPDYYSNTDYSRTTLVLGYRVFKKSTK